MKAIPQRTPALEEAARSRYYVHPSGCWIWMGSKDPDGYGRFSMGRGVTHIAHRVLYVWSGREIPDDYVIDHLCRVPSCVNPDHLEAVTVRENVRRGLLCALRTECLRGHPLSGANLHVSPKGRRVCITCERARLREWRRQRRVREAARANDAA